MLFWQSKPARTGLLIIGALAGMAIFAPWLAPHDASAFFEPMLSPSTAHPLGTDDVGHDLLAELLHGARFSLAIAFLSAGLSTVLGLGVGVAAGYYNRVGFAIMRVVDVFLAVPRFPLIVLMAAFLRPGFGTLLVFFVLFGWPRPARLVRAQVLSERNREYIEAARAVGAGDLHILRVHLVPGVLAIALVQFVMAFQQVILAESGLSFLGLGDPTVKSWGLILSYAFRYPTIFITDVWVRWALPPGLCITLAILALTSIGYALESRADPRLRQSAHERRPATQRAGRLTRQHAAKTSVSLKVHDAN
jgi:peptide/nickel transport system permease protein